VISTRWGGGVWARAAVDRPRRAMAEARGVNFTGVLLLMV
jgi:hypothetical protein